MDFRYPVGVLKSIKQNKLPQICHTFVKSSKNMTIINISFIDHFFIPQKVFLHYKYKYQIQTGIFKVIGSRFSEVYEFSEFKYRPHIKVYEIQNINENTHFNSSFPNITIEITYEEQENIKSDLIEYDIYGYVIPLINRTIPGKEGLIHYVDNKIYWILKFSASSELVGFPLKNIFDSDPENYYSSKDVENSYIEISFEDDLILLYNYSIRSATHSYPTSWYLAGSVDRTSFNIIHSIQNSNDFDSYTEHVYTINSPSLYSSFRLVMTGPNIQNRLNLVISGLEFYGYAIHKKIKYRSTENLHVYRKLNVIRKCLLQS